MDSPLQAPRRNYAWDERPSFTDRQLLWCSLTKSYPFELLSLNLPKCVGTKILVTLALS